MVLLACELNPSCTESSGWVVCSTLCKQPSIRWADGKHSPTCRGRHSSNKDVSYSPFQPRVFQFWMHKLLHGARKISQRV